MQLIDLTANIFPTINARGREQQVNQVTLTLIPYINEGDVDEIKYISLQFAQFATKGMLGMNNKYWRC